MAVMSPRSAVPDAAKVRQDLEALLNRDLLISQWPILRTLISGFIRDAWEDAFPELARAKAP
ncbi:hypothetical protein ACFZA1_36310 [Streptomyces filipinensis]|uniref:hypothetical protein n=1 Tax=Streptomyces filipinensis TaxID=66887 RepID=UPI0036F16441